MKIVHKLHKLKTLNDTVITASTNRSYGRIFSDKASNKHHSTPLWPFCYDFSLQSYLCKYSNVFIDSLTWRWDFCT